jgi:hypothetical protein
MTFDRLNWAIGFCIVGATCTSMQFFKNKSCVYYLTYYLTYVCAVCVSSPSHAAQAPLFLSPSHPLTLSPSLPLTLTPFFLCKKKKPKKTFLHHQSLSNLFFSILSPHLFLFNNRASRHVVRPRNPAVNEAPRA